MRLLGGPGWCRGELVMRGELVLGGIGVNIYLVLNRSYREVNVYMPIIVAELVRDTVVEHH